LEGLLEGLGWWCRESATHCGLPFKARLFARLPIMLASAIINAACSEQRIASWCLEVAMH